MKRARLPLVLLVLLAGCSLVDRDGDGLNAADGDCNDADARVRFGASEICDGLDNDCDTRIDEGFDADRDGTFDAAAQGCSGAWGALADCDDTDATVHAGAPETCDGRDEDCNGQPDDPWDTDGDGVAPCGGDCDDLDATVFPGASEVCNGLDDDCDGEVDPGFDDDGDGVSRCRGDCDDDDAGRHPFAAETCDDTDEDCDGAVDEDFDLDADGFSSCEAPLDCDDLDPASGPGQPEVCDGADNDCDGGVDPAERDDDADGVRRCDGDCDDLDAAVAGGFLEVCDGLDNDCEPATDELIDGDGDGRAVCGGDCDDGSAVTGPGQPEVCDEADNDCDGVVDSGLPDCAACEALNNDGRDYLFCAAYRPWEVAEALCRSFGLELAAMQSAEEDLWVWDRAGERVADAWWMGANDLALEGDWVSASGAPLPYSYWADGQPDNWDDEDCGMLWGAPDWNDAPCGWDYPFVCAGP